MQPTPVTAVTCTTEHSMSLMQPATMAAVPQRVAPAWHVRQPGRCALQSAGAHLARKYWCASLASKWLVHVLSACSAGTWHAVWNLQGHTVCPIHRLRRCIILQSPTMCTLKDASQRVHRAKQPGGKQALGPQTIALKLTTPD
jgi:hypothetical protein